MHEDAQMNRFSKPRKWVDPWFSNLPQEAMHLFNYLCDVVDNAGFIELNLRKWGFDTRLDGKVDTAFKALLEEKKEGSPSVVVKGSWVWLPNFIENQNNLPLNPKNPARKQIIRLLVDQTLLFGDLPQYQEIMEGIPTEDTDLLDGMMLSRDDLRRIPRDWDKERDRCQSIIMAGLDSKLHKALMKWWDARLEMGDPLTYIAWRQLMESIQTQLPADVINAIDYSISNGVKTLNFVMAKKIRLESGDSDTDKPVTQKKRSAIKFDWKGAMVRMYGEGVKIPRGFWSLEESVRKALIAENEELRKEIEENE